MKMIPHWVRITKEGEELIEKEVQEAQANRPSMEWIWFGTQIIDYREATNRTARDVSWRMRIVRLLLRLVDLVSEYKRY